MVKNQPLMKRIDPMIKATQFIMAMSLAIVLTAGNVRADWDVGDPFRMHWPQLPDLEFGMNVNATVPTILADNFLGTAGPITRIHLWGSWLDDNFPADGSGGGFPDPGSVAFKLSIHAHVSPISPAGELTNPGGVPGEELWSRVVQPGEFRWRPWATAAEDFFDPDQDAIIGSDTQVFQYNFRIPRSEAFWPQEGKVYWLDVMAIPQPWQGFTFGWKSSADHWQAGAVFGHIAGLSDPPYITVGDWQSMADPRTGGPIDLAFVIAPEPATIALMVLGGLLMIRRCD